jgi:hypothetical protein
MSELETAAPSQPVKALQRANHVRVARSELKAQVADGQTSAAEVILTSPPEIATMPIAQLLASQRGWGKARSHALLAQAALREDKSIGSLTERQRRAVALLLGENRSQPRGPARQLSSRRGTAPPLPW